MATTTPSLPPASPPLQPETDHRQPPISPSPPTAALPPPLSPIEDVNDHRELPIDHGLPPPEDGDDHQEPPIPPSSPPHEELHDRQQHSPPPSSSVYSPPPQTGSERPPENMIREHVSEIRQSLTEPEDQVENPSFSPNQQPPSPSTPPTGPANPLESPNYRNYPNPNPIPDHESPSPSPSPSPSSPPPESPFPSLPQENPSPKAYESPPPTATAPSSPNETPPPQPPLGLPLLLHATASSSPKPQPSPWTHQETANLIQAYQEKWYSLKKGPLKAGQWEEVAITVAARCGYDEPTKSAKQCRHKIEKLRKRYRAERTNPRSKPTVWNFFKLMDNLEKGPLPISSSRPLPMIEYPKSSSSNSKKRTNHDSDGEFHVSKKSNWSKSSNHHAAIANGGLARTLRFSDGVVRGSRTPMVQKHKGFDQDDDNEAEEEEEEGEEEDGFDEEEEEGVAAQLAAEIKGFAEKFVKMENKKIEMIRDTERYRMEMENKRMEMILESQQMLVETVKRAFSSSHKAQKLSAN